MRCYPVKQIWMIQVSVHWKRKRARSASGPFRLETGPDICYDILYIVVIHVWSLAHLNIIRNVRISERFHSVWNSPVSVGMEQRG